MSKPSPSSTARVKKSKRKSGEDQEEPKADEVTSAPEEVSPPGQDTQTDDAAEPEAELEVEVLSHAAQRKAKKRKLKEALAETTEDEPPTKPPAKPQSTDKPAQPVRQNSVWVGNLSFKTTESQLREFFTEAGEVSRIHLPKKTEVGQGRGMRGENRGFAYVDFTTPDGQALAVTFSERNLDGRRLLIKKGDDFAGRPVAPKPTTTAPAEEVSKTSNAVQTSTTHSKTAQKILRAQKQPAAQTLFMGNLPFETKEEDIREMIEGHGIPSDLEEQAKKDGEAKNPGGKPLRWLKKIRMGTFEDSGLCKGWAFLDFPSTAYATAVLVNPRNHHFNGRKLVLEYGSPDAVRRGGGGPRPRKVPVEKEEQSETPRAAKKRRYADAGAENGEDNNTAAEAPKRKPKGDEQYIRAKDGRLRPKPGAALAMAKKETVAIVESTGKKTVF